MIKHGSIIAPGAKVAVLFEGGTHLEGPALGPDGKIYFSDITISYYTGGKLGNIWTYDMASGATALFRSPSNMANGLMFTKDGDLIAAEGADFGGRRLTITDMETGEARLLAGLYHGKPFNSPNDLDIDSKGNVYFTDPRYFGHEAMDQPISGVYRVDAEGNVSLVAADMSTPNGIAFSPDEKTLYVSDQDYALHDIQIMSQGLPMRVGRQVIEAYDVAEDGSLSNSRVFVDYNGLEGSDGMDVDADGNLYTSNRTAGAMGVHVYNPRGEEIAYVPSDEPVNNVTVVDWDGKHWVVFTSGSKLNRIESLIASNPVK